MSAELLSLRAYGKHRKARELTGRTHQAIRKAIDTGRIEKGVHRDAEGREWIDPAVADEEWEASTDVTQVRPPPREVRPATLFEPAEGEPPETVESGRGGDTKGPTTAEAQRLRMIYQAQLARLDVQERLGKLVDAAGVRVRAFNLARTVRDKLLRLPDRLAAELAAETEPSRVRERLEGEIIASLDELSRGLDP